MLRRLLFSLLAWLAVVTPGQGAGAAEAESAGQAAERVLVLLELPPAHLRAGVQYASGYDDQQGRTARRRIALDIARRQGLRMLDAWVMPVIGYDCFVMSVPAGQSAAEAAARLSDDPRVAWAEPMNVYHGQAAAQGDPLYAAQPAAHAWRLAELHRVATGRNVRIAVIDSAVDAAHPDLKGQVQLARNFAPEPAAHPELHGTAVAGVIAARADNGVGVAGVAPRARVIALRACWESPAAPGRTVCDTLSLAKALVAAMEAHAQVVNLSLSGPPAPLLAKLIDAALARGAVVVSAFDRNLPGGGFPASHPGVVAVADAPAGGKAVVAPGRDIPTTEPGGRWGLVNGSSYAAAHVSGLVALIREHDSREAVTLITTRSGAVDARDTLLRGLRGRDRACACVSQTSARP